MAFEMSVSESFAISARPSPARSAAQTGWVSHPPAARSVPWERDAAERFARRMLDRERQFPCVFGVDALSRGTLRFAFVPSGDEASSHAAQALREFVEIAPDLGHRTSLVAFFEHSRALADLEDHRRYFWWLLQRIHEQDPSPWPTEIPTETEDPKWEFSFAGMPMFVVANTPAHQKRASRYFDYFCITFQPRFVFDDIAESSPQGRNARKIIRGRLRSYDSVPPTPLLGSYGAAGNREWMQYFLDDENASIPVGMRCPFTHHSEGAVTMPQFRRMVPPALPQDIRVLLPEQGSFELQNDQPGKLHDWHHHSLDEELFLLAGDVLLFWMDGASYQQRPCPTGTWITLPAGTVHGSVAGESGASYIIRPRDGRTAVTTFLPSQEHPHPSPSTAPSNRRAAVDG